jgi:two-component system, cell cycle sensor histidine kinase and response regulator CckA
MGSRRVTWVITILTAALAVTAVVIPVGTYVLFSLRYAVGSVETDVDLSSHAISHVVAANPEMWRFEHVRLVEMLARQPRQPVAEARRVIDLEGKVVAAVGAAVPGPTIEREAPLLDAGEPVGRVVITRTVRPIMLRAGLLLLVLIPLAALAFAVIRALPLRAIADGEEALRRSEARFRALIENSSDMIMVFDAEKRIVFWSPSATELLGWTAAEMVGKRLWDTGLIHPEDVAALAAATEGVASGPQSMRRVVTRNRHKDGSWRLVEGTGRNLLDDPAVRGVVVNARDVTERQQLEEQFRQSQKLESIGRLAGGVAHDFNNLLTVILSCSESLRQGWRAGLLPDPEDVEQIHQAGERARDLTRQLLAFARRQIISPVPLDLNTVVRSSERLLRRVLGEDIQLAIRVQPDLWSVLCDPGQIEQVLMNLAVNARDAMPRGGTLTLETRNLPAAVNGGGAGGDRVCLRVRDTGTGMTEEVRQHIFEPFFTSKEVGKGTGLGLATVHGIMAQSGGEILVESEPGQGTTFDLVLPRCDRPAVGVARAAAGPEIRGTETVLVIEDDPQVRAITVRVLRSAGFRVLVAGSGAEALELAGTGTGPIDVVVTDVVMPGMSGRSAVEALRALHPSLRVLFVSGYPQDAIAQRGVLDAGVDFLQKPFTPAALLARVRHVLDARA